MAGYPAKSGNTLASGRNYFLFECLRHSWPPDIDLRFLVLRGTRLDVRLCARVPSNHTEDKKCPNNEMVWGLSR